MVKRILLVLIALAAVPVVPSGAADPSSGTVSPMVSKLAYDGAEIGVARPTDLIAPADCVEGLTCDTFELTVDVPDGFYDKSPRELIATIAWTNPDANLNLYLCPGSTTDDPNCIMADPIIGGIPSSTQDAGTSETISVKDPEAGVYRLVAKSFNEPTAYKGLVTFAAPTSQVFAFKPAQQLGALAYDSLVLKQGGAEPAIAISPSGKTMLVAGLGPESPATLYRSVDYGKTFTKLAPTFDMTGGGDWDMYFLDDRRVVAADLTIGDGIYVHRSDDAGDTWSSTKILQDQYDRPWLDHFGEDIVYVVAKGFDAIPYLYTSTDGGRTFGSPPIPLIVYGTPLQPGGPPPNEAFVTNNNAYIDHIAVDQKSGDVYVLYGIGTPSTYGANQPLGASNELYIAHLEDGQMVNYPVYIGGPEDSFISGFNWLAIDGAGTVYALIDGRIDGRHSARLTYSKDKGKTWSSLVDLGPPGASNVFAAIAAEAPGVLALAYIRGTLVDPAVDQAWFAEMGRVTGADTASPKVTRSRPLAAPMHLQDICFDGIVCGLPGFGDDRNLLDFIWVGVDPTGKAYGIFASDGPATGSESLATPDILVLRQRASIVPRIPKPASKPAVRGTKRGGAGTLPATGVADWTAFGAALTACAAGLGRRLRARR